MSRKLGSIFQIPIKKIRFFKNDPKRRSYLDIQRMEDSIQTNGFIAPVILYKNGNSYYCIDGKCRILALIGLDKKGLVSTSPILGDSVIEVGTVPGIIISTDKVPKQIKEMVVAGHGTYSIMTERTLKQFIGKAKIFLHHYAFAEGSLINFYEEQLDVSAFFTDITRTAKANEKLGSLLV